MTHAHAKRDVLYGHGTHPSNPIGKEQPWKKEMRMSDAYEI